MEDFPKPIKVKIFFGLLLNDKRPNYNDILKDGDEIKLMDCRGT